MYLLVVPPCLQATENISQNSFVEYFMMHSFFEPLIDLVIQKDQRDLHGSRSLLILSLLVNYRKYEVFILGCLAFFSFCVLFPP